MTHPVSQAELQKTFIAMLFAFAVSVVAQGIAEWLIVLTNNWKSACAPFILYAHNTQHFWSLLAVGTHYLLAILMLTMSWIMWSRSQARGHLEDISQFLSLKFFVFLLELLLVTLYFSLAKTVEGDFAAYSRDSSIASYLTSTSARPEAMLMVAIFSIFAAWDYIIDVIKSPQEPLPVGVLKSIWSHLTGVLTYCSVSMICAILAILVLISAPAEQAPVRVILGDASLILLLFIFNRGKIIEHYICKIFPAERSRQTTQRKPPGLLMLGLGVFAFFLLLWMLKQP